MSKQKCVLCGRDPAAGFAGINGERYCHGDDDPEPTCYMRGQWTALPPDWITVFACSPCECGGQCDQCRQTERGSHQTPDGGTERPDSPLPSGGNREGEAPQPRSVCLCDPDVDGYCARECA